MNRRGLRVSPLYLVFFCSGAAGLGYQIVWLQMFATGLGHEMPATLAVVFACMGGMGLGAWGLDKPISRSPRPDCWYAGLEILIGLWGFLSTILIPLLNQTALQVSRAGSSAFQDWAIAFTIPFLALLPATAALGATFPAMERFVSRILQQEQCVGAIYAANTFGAVAGIFLGAFILMPALGLRESVWCFALISMICGVAVLAFGRGRSLNTDESCADEGSSVMLSTRRLCITIFSTGLFGIGYETAGVRVLSQVLENTVYTFAAVLSVFLLGTSIGAALYHRFGRRSHSQFLLSDLLCGLSLAGVFGVLSLSWTQGFYDVCRRALGDSQCGVLAAELTVSAAVFLLPTIFMGVVFSKLVQETRRPNGGVGQAVAFNTLGGALAPALFGVLLLPAIGSKWTLVLISLGYLALVPKIAGWRWGLLTAPLALLLVLPANLHIIQLPQGAKVAEYREGVMASVAVIEDDARNKTLRVNNRFQMGGTAAAKAEYRHAHIPLLLHPAPRRALFLGLGTGITFGAASLHLDLESDGVELLPEIVTVLPQFEPYNRSPTHNRALKVHVADARRFIRVTQSQYDVIVADLFHPARDGAGSLYTLEHFQAAKQRLAPGGIFCQWLPLHQLDEQMLRVIIRTFLEVFPQAQAYLLRFNVDAPVVGLFGSLDWPRYSPQWIETRAQPPGLDQELKKLALADSIRLFGNLIAGPAELVDFAGQAPLNTDDHPAVTFGAPRFTYQKNATSYGRLMTLLHLRMTDPHEVLKLDSTPESTQFAERLSDYLKARNVYLAGLVEDTEKRPAQAIDAFVESARLSADFTPGYAQCLTIASLEAKGNPEKARALLLRLTQAQPTRSVAAEMLKRLSAR